MFFGILPVLIQIVQYIFFVFVPELYIGKILLLVIFVTLFVVEIPFHNNYKDIYFMVSYGTHLVNTQLDKNKNKIRSPYLPGHLCP